MNRASTEVSLSAGVRKEISKMSVQWPKEKRVTRIDDMFGHQLTVLMEEDGDIQLSISSIAGSERAFRTVDVQFCAPGGGGGRSSNTRMALIALMVAIEKDNANNPIKT